MFLYWKPVAEEIKLKLKEKVKKYFPEWDKFLAILFFWENYSSKVYVNSKQKYWESIGLRTELYWQDWQQRWRQEILELINKLNEDNNCVGMIIQLPLPEELKPYQQELLSAISWKKDVDGLWGTLVWKSFFEYLSFVPATPKAVMTLLDYYQLWEVKNKKVAVIGQSTIVWKPLALELIKRGAQIACFDIRNTPEEIKLYTQTADYIFSATWQIQMIDETYLWDKKNQILVDIWYGHKDGKAVWDVNMDRVIDKVLHITPVPWGVGPLTIASLFSNVFDLREQTNTIFSS